MSKQPHVFYSLLKTSPCSPNPAVPVATTEGKSSSLGHTGFMTFRYVNPVYLRLFHGSHNIYYVELQYWNK